MLRARIIPCLLLNNGGLVKTIQFKNPVYVGDPLNAVKIFNEKEADELILLDISATSKNSEPLYDRIAQIASEAFMPLCYGGGISNVKQAEKLVNLGIEKISINSAAFRDYSLIQGIARALGTQSVVVSIDVKKDWLGRYRVYDASRKRLTEIDPILHARQAEHSGAGEILLNNVSLDGMLSGYDLNLVKSMAESLSIPLVVCGGAASTMDFKLAIQAGASAAAAGSMFLFQGKHRAVLISYLSNYEINQLSRDMK